MEREPTSLSLGIEAALRGAWVEALPHLRRAVEETPCGEAYEHLSWAYWSLNEPESLFPARETAYRLYRRAEDMASAARMAMWIASDYVDFKGEVAVANGWRQRARRMLQGQPLCAEHGWLLAMEGDAAMVLNDDAMTARDCAQRAMAIAQEVKDRDLEFLALGLDGFAAVTEGAIDEGMKILDEAGAAALGGEMSDPGYISWALCYLLYACERVRDYDRAVEWCNRLREFAERSGMSVLRGICHVHLAAVFIWRGNWQAAEQELGEAWPLLDQRPIPLADGRVRLGDLRLRQGRLGESEQLFREAEWHPLALQGLAELALDEGRPNDARELLERLLRHLPESSRTQRAVANEVLVRVYALQGEHQKAREALANVRVLSESIATLPLRAALSLSAGAVAAANGSYEEAREHFEDAIGLFERCSAPYESARARLELASILVLLERLDRARTEARHAFDVFDRLGSIRFAARAAGLIDNIDRRRQAAAGPVEEPILTPRQIEILRLISRGMSDREIASALVVSEHTVHRHVANILQRLDLPTRAAAVAHAGTMGLL